MVTSRRAATVGLPPELRAGVRAAVPLAIAVFGFGVSFGIVARSADMAWLPTVLMSATTYAGSAQFAAASVVGAGGGAAAAITAAVLLNSRYLPMGISIAPYMSGGVFRRMFPAMLMSDESWAVAHVGGGRYSRSRLIGAGALVWVTWVLGTAVGLVGAQALGDPERYGLDVVAPVIFLALLVGQVRNRRAVAAAALGALIALTLTPVTSPGVPLIAAVAAAAVGLGDKR